MSAFTELWLSCRHPYTPNKVNTERQYLQQMIYHPLPLCSCMSFDKYLTVHKLVMTKPLAAPCLSFPIEMHPLTPAHWPGFANLLLLQMAHVVMQRCSSLSDLMCPMTSPSALPPWLIQKARGLPEDHCSYILLCSSHAAMLPN